MNKTNKKINKTNKTNKTKKINKQIKKIKKPNKQIMKKQKGGIDTVLDIKEMPYWRTYKKNGFVIDCNTIVQIYIFLDDPYNRGRYKYFELPIFASSHPCNSYEKCESTFRFYYKYLGVKTIYSLQSCNQNKYANECDIEKDGVKYRNWETVCWNKIKNNELKFELEEKKEEEIEFLKEKTEEEIVKEESNKEEIIKKKEEDEKKILEKYNHIFDRSRFIDCPIRHSRPGETEAWKRTSKRDFYNQNIPTLIYCFTGKERTGSVLLYIIFYYRFLYGLENKDIFFKQYLGKGNGFEMYEFLSNMLLSNLRDIYNDYEYNNFFKLNYSVDNKTNIYLELFNIDTIFKINLLISRINMIILYIIIKYIEDKPYSRINKNTEFYLYKLVDIHNDVRELLPYLYLDSSITSLSIRSLSKEEIFEEKFERMFYPEKVTIEMIENNYTVSYYNYGIELSTVEGPWGMGAMF